MAEDLVLSGSNKREKYEELLPQIEWLISCETDKIANQANIIAALWQTFRYFWVGFYRVDNNELVLGPFQGPVACTRIARGKGVCGSAWLLGKTLLVPDVDAFPGHISCASKSRSEIVIPIKNTHGSISHVLDVDSSELNAFDEIDQLYLETLAHQIGRHI